MKRKLFLIIILIFILIVVTITLLHKKDQSKVCFEDTCFIVELAIKPRERSRGLMFRDHLDEDKGMLFIHEREGEYSFWMKNVSIPLDIIWINEEKVVVFISENAQPCSDSCPSIKPSGKAKYVLEINGGISDEIGLKVGDKIMLDARN
jgi:hypothetical protein